MVPLAESVGWLFGWLLRNSAHAAVLAAVIWILERTLLRRLPPRWRYGLWLLVFVRLLLPIAPASALSLFNLVDLAPGGVAQIALQFLGLPAPMPVPLTDNPHPLVDTPSWFLAALALWIPGAAALGVLLYRDHRRLQIALSHTVPVTDSYILDLLQQSKGVMRVRTHVLLVEGDHVTSPAISGCCRPRLLLPSGLLERMTTDEIRFLFLHELAHVKRADLALNWVLAGIQILHWFNPAVWFALRRLVSVREEVCDEFVLRSCFAGASRDYGLTLLHLLEECAPRRLMPALAGILDDVRTLRQRMRCIRTFGKPESHPWVPATAILLVAVTGLTENKSHNALILSASAPTSAEIEAARPHLRSKSNSSRSRTLPASSPAIPTLEPEPSDSGSTLRSFAITFRTMVNEAFGRRSRTGSIEKPTREALSRPALVTERARPNLAATAPPQPVRPAIVPAQARVAGRPYPLPPVGQRGDILRPLRPGTGEIEGFPARGRSLDVVPYMGRQATMASPSQVRQSS